MQLAHAHRWDVSVPEAIAIQRDLRRWVVMENRLGEVKTIAGVDVSAQEDTSRAAVVVLSYPDLLPLDSSVAALPLQFPYVPGLLSFREVPAILAAFDKLFRLPDLIIIDGQGVAHPRRIGIATHLGVLLDHPTIGCAKSRLCGEYKEPDAEAGSYTYLYDQGEVIGAVVRTKANVAPLFVSVGHRVDLATAIAYVLRCCRKYRLPETTHWAHQVAGGMSFSPRDDKDREVQMRLPI